MIAKNGLPFHQFSSIGHEGRAAAPDETVQSLGASIMFPRPTHVQGTSLGPGPVSGGCLQRHMLPAGQGSGSRASLAVTTLAAQHL